jgi:hypothetical protein
MRRGKSYADLFKPTPKRRRNEDNMKKVILCLLFIIAVACAWEDDEEEYSDHKHCGKYEKECIGGTTCIDGHCICSNSFECDGKYVDFKCDVNHCGGCNTQCLVNELCVDGACTCPNSNNACGTNCTACPTNQNCVGGACACPFSNAACGPGCTACLGNQNCVGGVCVCPNSNSGCENGGLNGACSGCPTNLNCVGALCTCPNSDLACTNGGFGNTQTCAACPAGEYCNGGTCTCFPGAACFDDLALTQVLANYRGLSWSGFNLGNVMESAVVSPNNYAFSSQQAMISIVSGTFTPVSMYILSSTQSVAYQASNGQTFETNFDGTQTPTLVVFPTTFAGITSFTFIPTVHGTLYYIDNFVSTIP